MPLTLNTLAEQVAISLRRTQRRVVFAESCTGGMVSAVLARIPGISDFHCGSAVVYRLDTKTKWIGVSSSILHEFGPVSQEVAEQMASGVLEVTPEADIGISITGHLGPNAPREQDGLIFIAITCRDDEEDQSEIRNVYQHVLPESSAGWQFLPGETVRIKRQTLATELVLSHLRMTLDAITV